MDKRLRNEVHEIVVLARNCEITLTEATDWIGEAIDEDRRAKRLKRKALKVKRKKLSELVDKQPKGENT